MSKDLLIRIRVMFTVRKKKKKKKSAQGQTQNIPCSTKRHKTTNIHRFSKSLDIMSSYAEIIDCVSHSGNYASICDKFSKEQTLCVV